MKLYPLILKPSERHRTKINVIYETAYKGFSTKNYETKEFIDIYNQRLNCMILKTKSGEYHCSKIILDGICIYPKESEEN